jgi:NTP pyrophosphatase (non-canonical NTP hydrolase)|tara:strand:+ start:1096 stop:1422 length:327 start_codon:yes stop_codon:yes gene_type:complete
MGERLMMYLNQYQQTAKETAIYPKERAIEYLTLGLTGEAGEVANKVKKVIRDGSSPDDIIHELGDVLWYLAMLATELGYSLDTIADKNLWKLANRKTRNVLGGSGDNR